MGLAHFKHWKIVIANLAVVTFFFFLNFLVLYIDRYYRESISEIVTALWALALFITVIGINVKGFSSNSSPILRYLLRLLVMIVAFASAWALAYFFNRYY